LRKRNQDGEPMTPTHPRWNEFCARLEGPEGCNIQTDAEGNVTWQCGGGNDKTRAKAILRRMGGIPIQASMDYFEANGGYCDCEILINIAAQP
jgi:hypothetical protein